MTLFKCKEFYDYYIRVLADNTSVIKEFDLVWYNPGFILRFPQRAECKIEKKMKIPNKLFSIHKEYEKWLDLLKIKNVTDLNKKIKSYQISEIIQIEEALQEKKIAHIADDLKKHQTKIILIAGPSSSGKTTFAKRLSVQLRVINIVPVVIGLDDYFLPRNQTPLLPNGEYDYENINALDIELLNEHLEILLDDKEIKLPKYNFITGNREESHRKVKLQENNIVIMEGIHALNEKLTSKIPKSSKTKIYVSALNQLNIDDHNRIPTTDVRKIRRIVRDKKFRGYSAEDTLLRWPAVREGEDKYIFPFQEEADFMFNSGLTYELAVLKEQAEALIEDISSYSPAIFEARRLLKLLSHFKRVQTNIVPLNSLLREFIGGGVFKY